MHLSNEDVRTCNTTKAETMLLLKLIQLYFEDKYGTAEAEEVRCLLNKVKALSK